MTFAAMATRAGKRAVGSVCLTTLALVVTGCRSQQPPPVRTRVVEPPHPVPQISPWPGTLASALRAAETSKYDEADRILLDFSVKHVNTPEGAESDFWRALLKLDPSNEKVTYREQRALLDGYLDIGSAAPRHAEVQILRRMVEASDSTRYLLTSSKQNAEAREKRLEEEIRRLTEVNERTAAELERIKRRLAPKP